MTSQTTSLRVTAPSPRANRQLRNFIGGEPVDGVRTFDNAGPGRRLARSPRCTRPAPHEVDPPSPPRAPRSTAPGAACPSASARPCCDASPTAIERRFDEFLAAEVRRHRQAGDARLETSTSPRAAANFRVFADTSSAAGLDSFLTRTARRPPRAQLRRAQAARRGRGDLPVEPAAAAAHLEGRAGAGLRQHRGRQALGGDPVDGDAARRGDGRGRRSRGRLQRRARLRPGLGRRVPHHATPASTAITFTGESAHRRGDHAGRRPARAPRARSSSAARTPPSSSPTPTSTRRSTDSRARSS